MNPIEIGKMIKERREFLGIDQISFCEIAEISQHTLSSIENGKGNPSLSTLQKVFDVLGFELKLGVKGVD